MLQIEITVRWMLMMRLERVFYFIFLKSLQINRHHHQSNKKVISANYGVLDGGSRWHQALKLLECYSFLIFNEMSLRDGKNQPFFSHAKRNSFKGDFLRNCLENSPSVIVRVSNPCHCRLEPLRPLTSFCPLPAVTHAPLGYTGHLP